MKDEKCEPILIFKTQKDKPKEDIKQKQIVAKDLLGCLGLCLFFPGLIGGIAFIASFINANTASFYIGLFLLPFFVVGMVWILVNSVPPAVRVLKRIFSK